MAEIHVEIGTHGSTITFPAQFEESLLEFIQIRGVTPGGVSTVAEDPQGVPEVRSALIEEGVDDLVPAIDSWFRDQDFTPERTNDGVGNFRWEFNLP